MAQSPDYYAVLGVGRDASLEEIRRAYRRQARRCHPDVSPDDPEAEQRFKQLTEAYRVLSDPDLRARYDMTGRVDGPIGEPSPEDLFSDFFDLVDSMFGFGTGPRAHRASSRRSSVPRGRDLSVTVRLSLEDVLTGATRELRYRRSVACPTCSGTGCEPGTERQVCSTCRGLGQVQQVTTAFFAQIATTVPCPRCHGRGYTIPRPCPDCRGDGLVEQEQRVEVEVPPGLEDGERVVLEGYGEYPSGGGTPGDLYVTVSIEQHPRFQREGAHLYAALPLNPAQAALGTTVDFEGLDGSVTVQVRPGTQHGDQIVLRGHGLPHRNNPRRRGDLILLAKLLVPRARSKHERQLLEELAKLWEEQS